MTIREFLKDLAKETIQAPSTGQWEFAPEEKRLEVTRTHIIYLINNVELGPPDKTFYESWKFIKDFLPKRFWKKYEGNEDLKQTLKAWIESLPKY